MVATEGVGVDRIVRMAMLVMRSAELIGMGSNIEHEKVLTLLDREMRDLIRVLDAPLEHQEPLGAFSGRLPNVAGKELMSSRGIVLDYSATSPVYQGCSGLYAIGFTRDNQWFVANIDQPLKAGSRATLDIGGVEVLMRLIPCDIRALKTFILRIMLVVDETLKRKIKGLQDSREACILWVIEDSLDPSKFQDNRHFVNLLR